MELRPEQSTSALAMACLDHNTGKILAYTLGDHKDEVFLKLKELLEPFGITQFYTDDWGAYERHLPPEQHTVGKTNTQ